MVTGPRSSGMAVIMALLIVALAATAAALVLWQQGLWWYQVSHDKTRAQLRQVSQASVEWSKEILRYSNATGHGVVALSQEWAKPLQSDDKNADVQFSIQLTDLQGRFNLNSLVHNGQVDEAQLVFYKQLLQVLRLPTALSESLVNVLKTPLPTGQNNQNAIIPFFRQEANVLPRVEMLHWISGYTPEVLKILLPNVTALPSFINMINVNTATPAVLKALLPGVGDQGIKTILDQRVTNYYKDINDFKMRLPAPGVVQSARISTGSSFFLLEGNTQMEQNQLRIEALLYSNMNMVLMIWQQEGPPLNWDEGAITLNTEP